MNRITSLLLTLGLSFAPIVCIAAEQPKTAADTGKDCGKDTVGAKDPYELLCCFTAKVKWIEIAGRREAKVVPIGRRDLRWLVGIEILSIEKPNKTFDKKGERILLVHSPATLIPYPRDYVVGSGRQFSFRVFGKMKEGVPRYRFAEVREVTTPKEKQP